MYFLYKYSGRYIHVHHEYWGVEYRGIDSYSMHLGNCTYTYVPGITISSIVYRCFDYMPFSTPYY